MKKISTILAALLLMLALTSGKPGLGKRFRSFTVMFYNIENLFDTIHAPGKEDEEFLPDSPRQWTSERYHEKLSKIGQVLLDIAAENGRYPAVIGLAEVENRPILEQITRLDGLRRARYAICHYESPDSRGIDAAFLYRPDIFTLAGSCAIPVASPDYPDLKTRDIVVMWGSIAGEPFCFMAAHWPSRLGGREATEGKRCLAASIMRQLADSIHMRSPRMRVVMMGDMNDDPADRSLSAVLGCKASAAEVQEGDLYNPFLRMFGDGLGTLAYDGRWNLFDNIVCSGNLVSGNGGRYRLQPSAATGYDAAIFKRPYMLRPDGTPLRTYAGGRYLNGYSDHLPVYINISR